MSNEIQDLLRIALPLYLITLLGIAFVYKSISIRKKIGKNPIVFSKDNSTYALIGRYFKLIMICIFIYIFLYSIFPDTFKNFKPIEFFSYNLVVYIGLGLLLISLILIIIAQNQMRSSWRIGIDSEMKTELVTSGLFSISRNPIFFGIIISLIGLFFATPNVVTIIFLILGYVLIQIQIRLEEDFLSQQHGKKYVEYKKRTRRFI